MIRDLVEAALAAAPFPPSPSPPGDASAPSDATPRIQRWIEDVAAWNRKIDLTAARSEEELVDLMLADAAWLSLRIPAGARVVDVGTGAGAPGLPLAILRPDLEVTLVEPMDKRVAFLRRVVGSDALSRDSARPAAKVVRGRGESIVGKAFDVAISRATLEPPEWLALGHDLAPDGQVWVLLARGEPPTHPEREIASDDSYVWPLTKAHRRAVSFRPIKPTRP